MGSPKEPTVFCSECRVHYRDYTTYAAHRKRKMEAGEGHIHCEVCGMEFTLMQTLERHYKQEHAHEQDLTCPGCHLHFTRLGGLFTHIENDECLKIGKGYIEQARLKMSSLGKSLAKQNQQDPKDYFGKFLGTGANVPDMPSSAVDFQRRFMGHIESGNSALPASSTLGSSGKVPEGPELPARVLSSHAYSIRSPDLQPKNLDAAEFPTPAEASTFKVLERKFQGPLSDAIMKRNFPMESIPANIVQSTKAQQTSGLSLRPGSLDTTEFPTLAGATAPKGNIERKHHNAGNQSTSVSSEMDGEEPQSRNPKTLLDSRWAPNKTVTASSVSHHSQSRCSRLHPIYDRNIYDGKTPRTHIEPRKVRNTDLPRSANEAAVASLESAQQLPGSRPQATDKTPAERAKVVPDQGQRRSPEGRSSHAQAASARGDEQSETTIPFAGARKSSSGVSLKTIPPHLRSKILRARGTDCSQVSDSSVDDQLVRKLPPHLQGGFGASLTTAHTGDPNDENYASTVKHRDQGTMRLPHVSFRDNRATSALPPHACGKVNDSFKRLDDGDAENESSNGDVPLELRAKSGPTAVAPAVATETQPSPLPSFMTSQSTVGGVKSCGELKPTKRSRYREAIGVVYGSCKLPPHLRGKPSYTAAASSTRPANTDNSPTPSMPTGQRTLEPADFGREPGVGGLPRARDNVGVVQSVPSYATIEKIGESLPPNFRAKQEASTFISANRDITKGMATEMATTSPRTDDRDASTHTHTDEVSDVLRNVTLKPTDTSVNAVDTMDPEEEGVELGIHDPQHPSFDARNYRSQFTGRFHCPVPMCGKGFKSMQGIAGHLASDVHRRPLRKYQCPHCLRYFKSTAALTQHSESQGRKCEIRNTSEFRPFLDQLTGGIADLEGIYEDSTNRYIVTEEAMQLCGDGELDLRARRAIDEQLKRQIKEKDGNYYDGKDIDW